MIWRRRPASILGHLFAGAVMRRWSYAHTQAALFIAACGAVGSILGLIVGLVRGER